MKFHKYFMDSKLVVIVLAMILQIVVAVLEQYHSEVSYTKQRGIFYLTAKPYELPRTGLPRGGGVQKTLYCGI